MENQPLISSRMKSMIECLTNINDVIQSNYQGIENEVQIATELDQLDTIEANYCLYTNYFTQKLSEVKQTLQNVNSELIKDKLDTLDREIGQYIYTTIQKIDNKRQDLLYKGLTPERIQKFHHYVADESTVSGQCTICIQDVEVGRKMMRFDCNHEFCKECIEGWFAEHKTCPNCRKSF